MLQFDRVIFQQFIRDLCLLSAKFTLKRSIVFIPLVPIIGDRLAEEKLQTRMKKKVEKTCEKTMNFL